MPEAPLPRDPEPGRPDFRAGYGLGDHEHLPVPWSSVVDRLTAARTYWIISTRGDGRPHAMPVWGVVIDRAVLFSTDRDSVKGRNLLARPTCVLHLESGDDAVIIEGQAAVADDRTLLVRFQDDYRAKYAITVDVDDPAFTVFRVAFGTVLAWRERDFPNSATRFRSGG